MLPPGSAEVHEARFFTRKAGFLLPWVKYSRTAATGQVRAVTAGYKARWTGATCVRSTHRGGPGRPQGVCQGDPPRRRLARPS